MFFLTLNGDSSTLSPFSLWMTLMTLPALLVVLTLFPRRDVGLDLMDVLVKGVNVMNVLIEDPAAVGVEHELPLDVELPDLLLAELPVEHVEVRADL